MTYYNGLCRRFSFAAIRGQGYTPILMKESRLVKIPSLQRVTTGGRFIPEIDGLRFVAISSVVLFHLQWLLASRVGVLVVPDSLLTQSIGHGARGVPLFFILSGFVLGLPFAAHYLKGLPKVGLGRYFLRRLTRLEPPYVLSMLICCALLVTLTQLTARSVLPHLGASLVYIHNVLYGKTSLVNGVAWSLEIEIQFYCLVPFLSLFFAIRRKAMRRAVLLLAIAGAMAMQFKFPPIAQMPFSPTLRNQSTILYYVQYFLTGFLLDDVYLTDWNEAPQSRWQWDVVSMIGWPLLFLLRHELLPFALAPIAFLLYCATFRSVIHRRILTSRMITTIGGMCYTIYLFHAPVISQMIKWTGRIHADGNYYSYFAVQSLLTLSVVVPVSIIYFVLIERPCMNRDWPRRLLSHLRRNTSESEARPSLSR
jgi:peptidoglycan/LPS O-acetylase OafA/YrhL